MRKVSLFAGIIYFLAIVNSQTEYGINHHDVRLINSFKGYTTNSTFLLGPDSAILNSGTISLVIPDEDPIGASNTLNASGISGSAVIDSVIVTFTIPHTFLKDVFVNLEAPNGQILNLVADHDCADPAGYQQTRITSDGSYPNIDPTNNSPITGTFKADAKTQNDLNTDPNNNGVITTPSVTTTVYSNLFSTPNGDWKIYAYDVSAGDVGTLVSWSIKIRYHVSGPLPISLFTFSGYKENNHNILKWSTVFEQNNRGFQLERSTDGIGYSPIGFISSQAVLGNSSSLLNYSFTDNFPIGDKQYYRLRQIDLNGNEKLSNIVLIKGLQLKIFRIDAIFPNPVTTTLNVFVNSPGHDKVLLQMLDVSGKLMKQTNAVTEIGSNTVSVDVSSLMNGVYMLKVISSTGETVVSKFIKQ